jgi:hypothetical protein
LLLLLSVGTVPVYLGDSAHLRTLLPHPSAAIFVSDFDNNITALADYLKYLRDNEAAYEVHRLWRKNFTSTKEIMYVFVATETVPLLNNMIAFVLRSHKIINIHRRQHPHQHHQHHGHVLHAGSVEDISFQLNDGGPAEVFYPFYWNHTHRHELTAAGSASHPDYNTSSKLLLSMSWQCSVCLWARNESAYYSNFLHSHIHHADVKKHKHKICEIETVVPPAATPEFMKQFEVRLYNMLPSFLSPLLSR